MNINIAEQLEDARSGSAAAQKYLFDHFADPMMALCCRYVKNRADAEELFSQFIDTVGPTGLLPEEYDPVAERSLESHPQAYSHLGLIRCARLLDALDFEHTRSARLGACHPPS